MNKTKIEWCDSTWNPVTGCLYNCEYCYAKKMVHRFSPNASKVKAAAHYCGIGTNGLYDIKEPWAYEKTLPYPFGFAPTLHRHRLDEYKNRKGRIIFVCSMADLFGDWIPDEWIEEVFKACEAAPQHKYLFLTKNPKRYNELYARNLIPYKDNLWFGTTITKPTAEFWWVKNTPYKSFVSIEPLHEPFGDLEANTPNWVIIGAETGNRKNKITPKREWIEKIVEDCTLRKIPVFMKDSLIPIIGEENMLREFPNEVKHEK